MKRIGGTLDETPIAQIALEEDRVVEVGVNGRDGDLAEYVPARYAELPESAYLTCVPISAARRWLGVIFADREGEDFPLEDGERETMMTLGRLAALTASVEHSTEQRESERRLAERVELTRDLHENAIQRLFGVALALGSEDDLTKKERERCQEELRSVVADLRRALTRPLETPERAGKACLGELLERLDERRPELAVDWARRGRGAARPRAGRPAGPERGAPQRRPPLAPEPRSSSASPPTARPSASRSRTTAPATAAAPAAAASACGSPPSRRCATRAWSSSARSTTTAGASASSSRSVIADGGRRERGPAGPGGRRPRRRPVGLPPAARAPELGRALPRRLDRPRGRRRPAAKLQPEVALVDMLLGTESGADVCEEIHKVSPATRVLLISGAGVVSPNVARTAGAAGFISKDWSAVDVVRAVRRVSQGQEVFAESAARLAAVGPRAGGPVADRDRLDQQRDRRSAAPFAAHG